MERNRGYIFGMLSRTVASSAAFLPLCDVLVSVEAPNDTITHSSHLVLYESQREQKRDGRRRRSGLMAERLCRDSNRAFGRRRREEGEMR